MDNALKSALREFQLGTRAEHWYGKTYAQFWAWFSAQEEALLAQASAADEEELRAELLELTADCDDAGYAQSPEWDDRVIERPD